MEISINQNNNKQTFFHFSKNVCVHEGDYETGGYKKRNSQ